MRFPAAALCQGCSSLVRVTPSPRLQPSATKHISALVYRRDRVPLTVHLPHLTILSWLLLDLKVHRRRRRWRPSRCGQELTPAATHRLQHRNDHDQRPTTLDHPKDVSRWLQTLQHKPNQDRHLKVWVRIAMMHFTTKVPSYDWIYNQPSLGLMQHPPPVPSLWHLRMRASRKCRETTAILTSPTASQNSLSMNLL